MRSLGVSQLIVAVNKLDTVQWSKERFDDIVLKLGKFLKTQVGFKDSDLTFVPVSGLTGANLNEEDNKKSGTIWSFEIKALPISSPWHISSLMITIIYI